jgi:TonB-dependent receptor
VGLFYKNISTFVQTLRQDIPFNQLGLPSALLDGTGVQGSELFLVSQPVNTAGGELKGFEVNLQKNLDFLPGFLRNFGVQTNYTFVDSDMEYLTSTTPGAPTVNQTLVGLSKHAANATLYYETERFSIRGSVAYRQGYLTQVPGSEGNDVQGTNSTTNFDMSASYNVTDKLKLTFEGINLSDEINDQYVDSSNRMSVYSHTGRQFFVGLRYQF